MRYEVQRGTSAYITDDVDDISLHMVTPPTSVCNSSSRVFETKRVMTFNDDDVMDTSHRKVVRVFQLPRKVNPIMKVPMNKQLYIVVGKDNVKELHA